MTAIALSQSTRRLFTVFGLTFALLAAASLVRPATAGNIWFEGGVFGSAAIRGYDVVAYFTQGKPVEGKSDYSHKWNNTSWRFASAAHRDLFAANPENTPRNMADGAPGPSPRAIPRPLTPQPGGLSTASST